MQGANAQAGLVRARVLAGCADTPLPDAHESYELSFFRDEAAVALSTSS